MQATKPLIGITMGDAAGVGPEIILKSFEHDLVHESSRAFVIGDASILERAKGFTGSTKTINRINHPSEAKFEKDTIDCLDLNLLSDTLPIGEVSPGPEMQLFNTWQKQSAWQM